MHYLLGAVLAAGQGLHYLAGLNNHKVKERWIWLSSQILISYLSHLYLLYYIFPYYRETAALITAPMKVSLGIKAIPLVLFGNLFTVFTGSIPFPWDFWVTIPLVFHTFLCSDNCDKKKNKFIYKVSV